MKERKTRPTPRATRPRNRFNGAAPVKERKTPAEEVIEHDVQVLQWGRSGEGAEDEPATSWSYHEVHASMGPLR